MARILTTLLAAVFTACGPSTAPVEPAKPDPTAERAYLQTLEELSELNREADNLLSKRRLEEAGALITKSQGLAAKLLSVPRPTIAAVEAVSDHDDLYGRMLLANKHYGWARMFFQKNVARWSNWEPQSEETKLRRKRAEDRIAECDRRMENQSLVTP